MVASKPQRDKTYADYLAVPEGTRAELIDGALYMSPQPKIRHVRLASVIGAQVLTAFGLRAGAGAEGPGGWWIFDEPECHLPLDRRVLVPDLAGWRRERMPVPPNDTHKVTLAPDWICEVLSPSTQGHDLLRKMPIYLAAGVEWAWIVNPVAERVEVYRAVDGEWADVLAVEPPGQAALPPFDAVAFDVGLWFAG